MFACIRVDISASLPAVCCGYHQRIADASSPQAAAQLMEQAVGQGLQRQHHQQSAEEQTVGWLQITGKKKKIKKDQRHRQQGHFGGTVRQYGSDTP